MFLKLSIQTIPWQKEVLIVSSPPPPIHYERNDPVIVMPCIATRTYMVSNTHSCTLAIGKCSLAIAGIGENEKMGPADAKNAYVWSGVGQPGAWPSSKAEKCVFVFQNILGAWKDFKMMALEPSS